MAYTELDEPTDLEYPECLSCANDPAPPRTVSPAYSNGLLTSIPDFASTIQRHANGMITRVDHSNAMSDSYTVDTATGMARPTAITFSSWQECVMPVITTQPDDWQQIQQGQAASLSVIASGTPSPSYQWYRVDPVQGDVLVWTGQTYSPAPSATTTYVVMAGNACGGVRSNAAVVDVIAGTEVAITGGTPQDGDVQPGFGTTLTVSAAGTAPLTYQWYRGTAPNGVLIANATSSQLQTGPLGGTTSYYVVVDNNFGAPKTSRTATVYVQPQAPGTLLATKSGTGVELSWGSAVGADAYGIYRNHASMPFQIVAATETSFSDAGCPNTCVYLVRALDASGTRGADSNRDIATMLSFASVSAGTTAAFTHIEQIRSAVNGVRGAASLTTLTWRQLLDFYGSPGVEEPLAGRLIRAAHITALRSAMDAALLGNGLPTTSYTDPALSGGGMMKAIHITELQMRAQ